MRTGFFRPFPRESANPAQHHPPTQILLTTTQTLGICLFSVVLSHSGSVISKCPLANVWRERDIPAVQNWLESYQKDCMFADSRVPRLFICHKTTRHTWPHKLRAHCNAFLSCYPFKRRIPQCPFLPPSHLYPQSAGRSFMLEPQSPTRPRL